MWKRKPKRWIERFQVQAADDLDWQMAEQLGFSKYLRLHAGLLVKLDEQVSININDSIYITCRKGSIVSVAWLDRLRGKEASGKV